MGEFAKRYWAAAVSIATVVGLYVGAVAIHLVLAFWIVMLGSLVIAGGPIAGRRALDYANRIRNYDVLLKRAAASEEDATVLRERLDAERRSTSAVFVDGIIEGRKQAIGAILSGLAAPATLLSISKRDDGLVLAAKFEDGNSIANGTRFALAVAGTGDVRAVVEVFEFDEAKRIALMTPAPPIDTEFWRQIAERAETNPDPPTSLRLEPTRLDLPPTIGRSKIQEEASE